jgi:hypothetical protein
MNLFKTKGNIFIALVVFIIIVAISSFSSIISFLANYQWFGEVGYTGTFLTKIKTQLFLGIPLFIIVFFVFFLFVNRLKNKYYEETGIVPDESTKKNFRIGIKLGSAVISFFFTISIVSDLWFDLLKFFNSTSFNFADPIFGNDVSFYVFKLPVFSSLINVGITLIFAFIVLTVLYNILVMGTKQVRKQKENEKVIDFEDMRRRGQLKFEAIDKKMIADVLKQISIYGFLLMILIGITLWLRSYSLLYSARGAVFGAGYTDVLVDLNVYRASAILAFVGSIAFLLGARKKKLKMALMFPVLIIVVTIAGGILGGIVENFIVEPDQISKESQYIQNNIQATRKAFKLDQIETIDFPVQYDLSNQDIENNPEIIKNIRINDYRPIQQTYNQIQGIRPYYLFNDVDVDRYMIDGEYRQTFISGRELDQSRLTSQAQNWVNQYLKYTHGYGFALSPVNEVNSDGQPVLMVRDIPPTTTTDLNIQRPEIYFGEKTNEYVIVKTDEKEFDYPLGTQNAEVTYEGEAGIELGGLNKLLFSLRERSYQILISNNINSDSRIVLHRNIMERVNKIAPFINFDGNPYLILNQDDGKLYWIIEGFTTSDKYPYSQPLEGSSLNYVRNSVKVVIDAYNGTTDFYIADADDPIIETYNKIFPDLLKPYEEMPTGIEFHTRYSQTFFDIQSELYRTYHMTDTTVFFGREDYWDISSEKYMDGEQTVESNYVMFKLPDRDNVEFLLTVPYSPTGKNNMTAMLVGGNDLENYGKLFVYKFPKGQNISGTNMFEARIDQDSDISPQLTLWSQEGSSVLRGNVIIIPIEDSLLYVEPIYIQASNGTNSLPEMKQVIVGYDDQIVMETNLSDALDRIFGDIAGEPGEGEDGEVEQTIEELIIRANEAYQNAVEAQRNGNWSSYGRYISELERLLERLQEEQGIEIEEEIEDQVLENLEDSENTETQE